MNRDEYEHPGKLKPVTLTPREFEEGATYHGWDNRTIGLLLKPPMLRAPFQMGKYLVTLEPYGTPG